MTSFATAALTGLFLWTNAGGASFADASSTVQEAPKAPTYTVAMTAYNAVPGQTDSDPFTTASGAYSDPDIIAARSQDLADELPFGTVIEVTAASSSVNCGYQVVDELVGLRVIGDTMNARMRNKVDILFDTHDTVRAGGKMVNPAIAFGICKSVQIRVVGHVEINSMPRSQKDLRLAIGYLPKATQERLAIQK